MFDFPYLDYIHNFPRCFKNLKFQELNDDDAQLKQYREVFQRQLEKMRGLII